MTKQSTLPPLQNLYQSKQLIDYDELPWKDVVFLDNPAAHRLMTMPPGWFFHARKDEYYPASLNEVLMWGEIKRLRARLKHVTAQKVRLEKKGLTDDQESGLQG